MKQKRGVALIFVMVLSVVLLITSSTMANYVFKENRMTVDVKTSADAIAAAESGVLWAQQCLSDENGVLANCTGRTLTIKPDVEASIVISATGTDRKIESTGKSGSLSRKVEATWKKKTKSIALGDAQNKDQDMTAGLQVSGNFSMEFDYWRTGTPTNDFGLFETNAAISASNPGLYIHIDNLDDLSIIFNDRNGVAHTSSSIDLTDSSISNPYFLKVKVEYIKGLAARATVYKFISGRYVCFNSVDLALSSVEESKLPEFKFFLPVLTGMDGSPEPVKGDAWMYKFASNDAFLDNLVFDGVVFGNNWIKVPAGIGTYITDKYIYNVDGVVSDWGFASPCIVPDECSSVGILESSLNTNKYPAQRWCALRGGRLPSKPEMNDIYTNRATFGDNFVTTTNTNYWTNRQYQLDKTYAYTYKIGSTGVSTQSPKDSGTYFRCIRDN